MSTFEFAKIAGYLLSPLTVIVGLWLLAALCLALRRRGPALGLALLAFAGLWVASMPVADQALTRSLEAEYRALTVEETPAADAIVVLGGALSPADPPRQPYFGLGPAAGRVWHAARLYRAGKARWVVIAAGNQPGSAGLQPEADAIAEMLGTLGVPPSAIRRESGSRNTRENAANVRAILEGLPAHRVLLVTSALHMPRAVRTFKKVWAHSSLEIVPAVTDIQAGKADNSVFLWIPSPYSLLSVTKAVKEYAGLASLAIM